MNQPFAEKIKICLFPCAGVSNVGQLTRQAVQELVLEGKAEWVECEKDNDVQTIRCKRTDSAPFVVVDGCEQYCARKQLEAMNCDLEFHLSLADLGIEKAESAVMTNDELQLVKDAIVAESTRISRQAPKIMGVCCCR
jgi:uncharacterized metal-binding protein